MVRGASPSAWSALGVEARNVENARRRMNELAIPSNLYAPILSKRAPTRRPKPAWR
jgi:hypothetical protein